MNIYQTLEVIIKYLVLKAIFYGCLSSAIHVSVDSTVQLDCPFKRSTSSEIFRWYKSNNGAINGVTFYAENENVNKQSLPPDVYNRLSITGNPDEYHLVISNVTTQDSGQYRCNLVTSNKVHDVQLIVIDAPSSVLIQNKNSTNNRLLGSEGDSLVIECTALGGDPDPSVTLHIPGLPAGPTEKRRVTHTLLNVGRTYDTKTINCTASNNPDIPAQLTDFAVIYLDLKPLQPTLPKLPISTLEWAEFIVTCTSQGSRPVAALQWKIGQNVITSKIFYTSTHDATTDTYNVTSALTHSVNRSVNNQNITCTAVNRAEPNGVSTSVLIDIKYPPDVRVGNVTYKQDTEVRTVQCTPNGNPNNYRFYKWQHKSMIGQFIQELDGRSDGVLTLHSNSVEEIYKESGEYICTVSNGISDMEGHVNQTGSGYVTINAQPVFINDNKDISIQYGEFDKQVILFVYVYSCPAFNEPIWIHGLGNDQSKCKTDFVQTVVTDEINGKQIQLDGYKVTLTIDKLREDDFTNYTLKLSNGIGPTVQHVITLKSGGAPQSPINFTISSSSESSVTVQWIPGYNGGQTQSFYLEYRIKNSSVFLLKEVPNEQLKGVMYYTLTGLQDGTWFEMRMYAKNEFNDSLRTDIETIQTLNKANSQISLAPILGGVGGGLGVIIVTIVIVVFTKRNGELKDTTQNESQTYGLKPNILYQSAGSYEKPLGTEYAEVVKNPKTASMLKYEISEVKDSAECSSVEKKEQKKNEKVKKKKITLEDRAESGLPLKKHEDAEYANSGTKSYTNKKNADGLEYADIYFTKEQKKCKQPVIHGEEDRTVYSEIDLTKKAPPAPTESEYEETNLRQVRKI